MASLNVITEKFYKPILVLIFVIGILVRLFFYIKNSSLWLDEASLAINVVQGSYIDLLGGLKLLQASPPAFTIISKFLVNIFPIENFFIRDLILRFLPFISGVLSIFAFYSLLKIVFKNNQNAILTGLFFLALNPAAVLYSVQYKQYSLELLVAIVLLIIFYKILLLNQNKWYYSLIIALAPWFSYSSFFIIISGLFGLLWSSRKKFVTLIIPFIFSCLVYYFISLKSVFKINYSGMDEYWSMAYSFFEFKHPTRILYRLGDLFTMSKYPTLVAGLICFIAEVKYVISKDHHFYEKILFVLPIILTLFASIFHKYPFCCRLILFLLPLLFITIVSLDKIWGNILKLIIVFIFAISIFNYFPDAREYYYTYARDVVNYVLENKKQNDVILLDNMNAEYKLYLGEYDDVMVLNANCLKNNIEKCAEQILLLPRGNYYFLSSSYYAKEIVQESGLKPVELNLSFEPKKCKAVYFKK